MTQEPLDNEPEEWGASIMGWLSEGMRILRQLEGEADEHGQRSAAKRELARVIRRAFEDLGVKAPPARK